MFAPLSFITTDDPLRVSLFDPALCNSKSPDADERLVAKVRLPINVALPFSDPSKVRAVFVVPPSLILKRISLLSIGF